jgi:hypothetical protein
MNANRLQAVACALALFTFTTPISEAAAQDMEKALAAVKSASDADLRKEVERRQQLKKEQANAVRFTNRGLTAPENDLTKLSDTQLVTAAHTLSRAIYGLDSRADWYQLPAAGGVEPLARATVALFDADKIEAKGDGTVHIKAKSYQETWNLCTTPKVRFAKQPTAAFCSGVLVRPDLVLTAGHCVREVSHLEALPASVAETKFIFGYAMRSADADPLTVPAANVFTGKQHVGGERDPLDAPQRHDWALVRLDRSVPAALAAPVTDWQTSPVTKGQSLFVIGFPAGLPLKYADRAAVRDDSNSAWFTANLDTFGGNSGSAVYDQTTRKLAGILVRGEVDYNETPTGCRLVNLCPDTGCSGETISRLDQVRIP